MFRLTRELRDQCDREAIGSFILSMTHDAADVLGAHLLAKEAGLFADAAGTESCTFPVVPLFESIDDLRRAPEIVRRSEEHTSELQSPYDLVCRLLLEKKKKKQQSIILPQ